MRGPRDGWFGKAGGLYGRVFDPENRLILCLNLVLPQYNLFHERRTIAYNRVPAWLILCALRHSHAILSNQVMRHTTSVVVRVVVNLDRRQTRIVAGEEGSYGATNWA